MNKYKYKMRKIRKTLITLLAMPGIVVVYKSKFMIFFMKDQDKKEYHVKNLVKLLQINKHKVSNNINNII